MEPEGRHGSQHTVMEELHGVIIFISLLWVAHVIGWILPDIRNFGVHPGRLNGLIGVVAMPFLHGGIGHLVSNSVPLVLLLILLAGSRANSVVIVVSIILLSGMLLWAFSLQRDANHIGASGLVYGLISFLTLSGFLERRIGPLIVSIVVLLMFGLSTSIWAGMLPQQGISWDGHLYGAVAGAVVAYTFTREKKR